MSLKLLLSTTETNGKEKEVFHWTDAIYPQHIPLPYSHYVDFFAYPMRAKITEMNVGIIFEE